MKSNTLRKSDLYAPLPSIPELDDSFLNLVSALPKYKQKPSAPKRKPNNFKVYKSSPGQRLHARVNAFTKSLTQVALIGVLGAALSYFCSMSLEAKVSHRLHNLEKHMKSREDLKSYLGRLYSWQNLNVKAEKLNLVQAHKIENALKKKSIYHMIFEAAPGR
jgi:hypothetical protein